jgi:site-specific recombinase XerD
MKDELINKITALFAEYDVDTYDISQRLYLIFNDYEISKVTKELALCNKDLNEKVLNDFILAKISAGLSKNTIYHYRLELRKILDRLNKPYNEVTADDIRFYLANRQVKEGLSKASALNELRYMQSFFGWCVTNELILRNPCLKVERVKQSKKKKKALTDIEIEKLRGVCRNNKEKAILEILLSTGCRVMELCQMKISDTKNNSILIRGKGDKERTVYLNAKAQIALENYVKERTDNNPYVFPKMIWVGNVDRTSYNRQALMNMYKEAKFVTKDEFCDRGTIEHIMRKLASRAGIERANPHKLRRTCATMALRRGMPIEQVSRMLGHEQLTTTQIYLDLSDDDLAYMHSKYVV